MPNGYRKPVVTEAILDLRVALLPGIGLDALASIAEVLRDRFPRQEAMFTGTYQFGFYEGQALTPEATQNQNGFRLTSADGMKVIHIGVENFTFSRLQSYTGWEAFSAEARQLWDLYKASCALEGVQRVGLRYINRIDIPVTSRLSSFLALRPLLPEQLPSREMLGFFMQVQLPQDDLESMLIVNEGRVSPTTEDVFTVVLDFDLFRESSWGPEQNEAVWELLGQFRLRKNEVFEASIEEETRRLMK